jgi:(4S)-4-hydroxy-5-phosphonooxypentane-2,3-dione isomerase
MYAVVVPVFVKREFVEQFKSAILDNATNTRKEPGNIRFDVIQQEDDPTRFTLYEIYKDQAGFVAHQQTPHYIRWKTAVADWMAQPRVASKGAPIFFGDAAVR